MCLWVAVLVGGRVPTFPKFCLPHSLGTDQLNFLSTTMSGELFFLLQMSFQEVDTLIPLRVTATSFLLKYFSSPINILSYLVLLPSYWDKWTVLRKEKQASINKGFHKTSSSWPWCGRVRLFPVLSLMTGIITLLELFSPSQWWWPLGETWFYKSKISFEEHHLIYRVISQVRTAYLGDTNVAFPLPVKNFTPSVFNRSKQHISFSSSPLPLLLLFLLHLLTLFLLLFFPAFLVFKKLFILSWFHGGQNMVHDPLELESQTAVSHWVDVGAKNQTCVF